MPGNIFFNRKKHVLIFVIALLYLSSGFLILGDENNASVEDGYAESVALAAETDSSDESSYSEEANLDIILEGDSGDILINDDGNSNILEAAEEIYIDIDEINAEDTSDDSAGAGNDSDDVLKTGDDFPEIYTELGNASKNIETGHDFNENASSLKVVDPEKIIENSTYISLDEIINYSGSANLSLNETFAPDEPLEISQDFAEAAEEGSDNDYYMDIVEIIGSESFKNKTAENMTGELAIGADKDSNLKRKEITHVFYKGNQKEFETKAEEGMEINIQKTEIEFEESDSWKKDVKVYSEDHFNNPLTVYTDITESREENIRVYWKEEGRYLDFEAYDENGNGLVERISWVVPHLSEQNFEIIIELNSINDSTLNEIIIETADYPKGNLTSSPIFFSFNVSHSNVSSLACNFTLNSSSGEVISDATNLNKLNYSFNLSNGEYNWRLECYDESNLSVKNSSSGGFSISVDYSPSMNFSASNNSIKEGDSVTFYINISTKTNSNIFWILDFGDKDDTPLQLDFGVVNKAVSHTYSLPGIYIANLTAYIDDIQFEKTLAIDVNAVPYVDSDPPSVDLISPEDGEVIRSKNAIFTYKASDNIGLDNCTLNIYYYNNSIIGNLIYSIISNNVENGTEMDIDFDGFDEGEYSWDVGCYDNSTNYRESSRDFSVNYSNSSLVPISSTENETSIDPLNQTFEKNKELEELIDYINNFFIKEEKYSLEEREAIKDLGISDNLKFYKKKLLQMKLDLDHNLNYIKTSEEREKRKEEILDEIEEIRSNIPVNLKVIETHEYLKNSMQIDMEEIVKAYVDAKNIVLSKGDIKGMAIENDRIKDYLKVSVSAKQIEIEYLNRSEEITLVAKDIKFVNESFDSIIEVIPKDVARSEKDISFIGDYIVIKDDPIFEIKPENIKDGKIVYSIRGAVDLEEIEKTTTLPFIEVIPGKRLMSIGGFATLAAIESVSAFWLYASWGIAIIIFLTVIFFIFRKARISKLKKKRDVKRIFEVIKDIEDAMENEEFKKARDRYHELEELYFFIPSSSKRFFYRKIDKLRKRIDEKDISSLFKEFKEAVREKRKNDALLIYEDIKKIYSRMPRKYKKKVYTRIMPYVKSLKKP